MKDITACFSHKSDDWKTPSFLYWWFVSECRYFDPCPYKCDKFDGLRINWNKNVFCNPPYSQIDKWVDKAIEEHLRQPDSDIVLLVPSRTDTKWFNKLMEHASEIRFIKGRLHFNDSKDCAPFPSMIVSLCYGNRESSTSCCCDDLHLERQFYEEYKNEKRN